MTDTFLHPSLQPHLTAHRRLSRLLSLLLFLPMAGMMVFAMATALHGDTLGDLLLLVLIGGIVLLMVVSLGGLLWWLDHWTTQRLADANRLLQNHPPINARLIPTDVNNKQGLLMVVHLLDPQSASGTGYILIEPSLGRRSPPSGDISVQLYCQNLQPGSRLVALQEGIALLGKLVDGPSYCRRMQWARGAVIGVLLAIAVVIGTLGLLKQLGAVIAGAVTGFLLLLVVFLLVEFRKHRRLRPLPGV